MKWNRGSMPAQTEPPERRPRLRLEVHAQDSEGFWTVIAEPVNLKTAIKIAEQWKEAEKVKTRVVQGERRDVVREF